MFDYLFDLPCLKKPKEKKNIHILMRMLSLIDLTLWSASLQLIDIIELVAPWKDAVEEAKEHKRLMQSW